MTINDAISRIDEQKPNNYTDEDKVRWLSTLDMLIHREIILTHEHTAEQDTFAGYSDLTDLETVLIVPAPYDKVYLSWLSAQIDYANLEFTKYNNSITMFNADYTAFNSYYNRNNMPIGGKIQFF